MVKKTTDTKKVITKEMVTQAWTGALVGVILFLVIFPAFLWGWGQWWSYMVAAFILIGPISTTMTYYTQDRIRCPYCQAELTSRPKICPQCGNEILTECPSCHTPVGHWGARFCETCGANLRDLGLKLRQPPAGAPVAAPVPVAPVKLYCLTCGEEILDGAKFCFRCGSHVG